MSKVDILAAFETQPEPPDFILPGLLAGTVGALIAPGSTGKSFWAMEAACAIASPEDDANLLELKVEKHGKVLYLSLEDPASELHRRLHAMGTQFSPETRRSIATQFHLSSLAGIGLNVMDAKAHKQLVKDAEDARLIVIDTLSRAHKLDENSNGEMAQLLGRLESIAKETGAGVLFLHHTSKAAALNGQGGLAQASRGASALIDNARWCGNLVKMTSDEAEALAEAPSRAVIGAEAKDFFVKFELGKINYGTVESSRWYKRCAGGVLYPAKLQKVTAQTRPKGGRDDI